jgi:hypothetical protein
MSDNSGQKNFYDAYGIDEQYQRMRKLMAELELDAYKFIGRTKNRAASVRARKTLKEIWRLSTQMRESIRKQRQDNASEY